MTAEPGELTWHDLHRQTARSVGSTAEARWLCERAGGFEPSEWAAAMTESATARSVARLDAMVARRLGGEPIQYALGVWAFRHLELLVDRRVLIPRPETEEVVEVALGVARRFGRAILAADLGTGSGAIALSLAHEMPLGSIEIWATDASADALDVARANLAGVGRAAVHVRLAEGSWWDALDADLVGRLDVVVSNPPYVADGDERLDASVRDWEPGAALFAGPDGLDAYRAIVADAPRWLAPDGWLVLEVGSGQGHAVGALLADVGLVDVEVCHDVSGHERVVLARRAP